MFPKSTENDWIGCLFGGGELKTLLSEAMCVLGLFSPMFWQDSSFGNVFLGREGSQINQSLPNNSGKCFKLNKGRCATFTKSAGTVLGHEPILSLVFVGLEKWDLQTRLSAEQTGTILV